MNKAKNIFLLYLLLVLFKSSLSEGTVNNLNLNQISSGKINTDNSYDYYELFLPESIPKNNLLVFTVREDKIKINKNEELFSDPDIYISKTDFAKNKDQSDWYSGRFGNDIVTILSKELKDINKLFISLYCERKCKYNLKSYFTKELELKLGTINSIKLSKHNSIHYSLKIKNVNYTQLKVIAYSPEKKHFHFLMAKDKKSLSSQNSINAVPFYFGGYIINIDNTSSDYCINCRYHLLFQTEEDSTLIRFYAFFQNTFTQIDSGQTLIDSLEKNLKRCYYYDIKQNLHLKDISNDKIIIQITLFGGEAFLHISGFNQIIYNDINDIKKLKNYGFQIYSEKSILITKKDIKIFGEEYDTNIEGDKNNKIYFCVYGLEKGSYMLNINNINSIANIQKYNYVFPGQEINGFLLQGQVTSYQIMDNDINKNSNITLSLKNQQGNAKLYGYFCDSEKDFFCSFGSYKLQNKLDEKEMIFPQSNSMIEQHIFIENKNNYCHSKKSKKDCTLLAVIECLDPDKEKKEKQICSFSLSAKFEDIPILMSPRKTYYNFISKGKLSLYEISITDPDINTLTVVLSTNIGNAELKLESKDNKDFALIKYSQNEYNIPDVIRVRPSDLYKDNLIGQYYITIYTKYFSSYNLYYYTTSKEKKEEKRITAKDVTMTLNEGQIIQDYFPNNIDYKIYYYTPNDKSAKDIKITLTRVNARFTFYVFSNLKDIKINNNIVSIYDEIITGYKWSSDTNNEITISKDDKNYKKKGNYYIVVMPDITTDIENIEENEENKEKIIRMYYIGVTKEGIPFYLKEGIEHSVTLNNNYLIQGYTYTQFNISNPNQIVINMLNGKVDLFITNLYIEKDDLTHIYNILNNSTQKRMFISYNSKNIFTLKGISDYASIILDKDFFMKINPESNGIINMNKRDLFIYISQNPLSIKFNKDSQYIITAKNSINKASILLSGHVYKNKLKLNNEEYFIIEEVEHRESLTISAKFQHGSGEIYAKIIDNNEEKKLNNKLLFPNSTYYDYQGNSVYMGKMLQIPGKIFDEIGKTVTRIKILITVLVKSYIKNDQKEVEYTISFSDEAKRINQNIPYHNSIMAGEFQYYAFYFDKNTENILISLSNMNGDADLFLNYGNEIYPTPSDNDWCSTSLGHEYIDININDNFFKKNNINTLAGYYTLLIVGYTNTTYTLYVSSHDEYIFKLIDNTPMNCKCETKDDKCFFRYDDIVKKIQLYEKIINNETLLESTEIIFTSQYLYGNGKMYASILKEQDIYTNTENKKYIDFFPSKSNNDFNNAEYGKRNYLKVKIPDNKYSIDSIILMTFICEEKTDVEITSSPLTPSGDYKYIIQDRENIFYIKYNDSLPINKQLETFLAFYSYKDNDIIYEFHTYIGMAKIHIYTNESRWNNKTNEFYYEYNHISEFVIKSQNENDIKNYNKYFVDEYFNTINQYAAKGKTILFSIKPITNFGFYLQLTFDKTWVNVPIGKEKNYLIKNKVLYGYFDIYEEFSSIEVNFNLKNHINKKATVYIKLIVDNKIKKINELNIDNNNITDDKLKHYEIPSRINYDYKAESDNYFGVMNINIENIPEIKKEEKGKKIVRGLFVVRIIDNSFQKNEGFQNIENLDNNNNNYYVGRYRNSHSPPITPYTPFWNNLGLDLDKDSTINILITPGQNNYKRIDTVPYTFYFSNISLMNNNKNNNSTFNGNKEIKIYSLDKLSDKDTKMVVQINICSGSYDIKFSSKIINSEEDNNNDINYFHLRRKFGRNIYLLNNLKSKHIYLSIKSNQNEKECNSGLNQDSNVVKCSNELSYLLHYYSATEKKYDNVEPIRKFDYSLGNEGQIILILPKLKEFDYHNNYVDKNYIEYNLFWTYNKNFSRYMENLCYLGHLLQYKEKSEINVIQNIQLNEKNEYVINNIEYSTGIYINILVRNLKSNEIILYNSIKARILKPNSFAKILSYIIAIFFICLIAFISLNYYKKENYYLEGYKLANSYDNRRDDIKYTNINSV